MIQAHKLEDGRFVVSENGVWVPGIYDSSATAIKAAETLTDEQIITKLGPVYEVDGEDRPATLANVEAAAR